jgi:hypothetical protein
MVQVVQALQVKEMLAELVFLDQVDGLAAAVVVLEQ